MRRFARYWLPPVCWMALIWWLSSDVGSARNTSGLIGWIVATLVPWATPADVQMAHGLLRKLGHVTEYAILAGLWFRALHTGRQLGSAPSALAALVISVTWAVTDELHQAFVPTRTASPVDVLIDTIGAAIALLALLILRARAGRTPPPRPLRAVPAPHPSD